MKPLTINLCNGKTASIDPLDLSNVTPVVIAHGLSNTNRFSGQTERPITDAEHSVHLTEWLRRLGFDTKFQRFALIHDACECLGLGDPHGGVKHKFAPDLCTLETKMLDELCFRLGVHDNPTIRKVVSIHDHEIGDWEAFYAGFAVDPECVNIKVLCDLAVLSQPPIPVFWPAETAKREWLAAWEKLV